MMHVLCAPALNQEDVSRCLDGESLAKHQLRRLNALLDHVLPQNRFYAEKLAEVQLPIDSLDILTQLALHPQR